MRWDSTRRKKVIFGQIVFVELFFVSVLKMLSLFDKHSKRSRSSHSCECSNFVPSFATILEYSN